MAKKRNENGGLKKGLQKKQSAERPALKRTVSKKRVFSDKLTPEGKQEMRELRKTLRRMEKIQVLSMEWQVKLQLRRMREANQMFLFAGREDEEMRKETLQFLKNAEAKLQSEFDLLKSANAETEANRKNWDSRPPLERLAYLRAFWEGAQEMEAKKQDDLEQKRRLAEEQRLETERKLEALTKRLREWRRSCEISPAESLEQVRKDSADLQKRIAEFIKEREEVSLKWKELNAKDAGLVDEWREMQERLRIAEEVATAGQAKDSRGANEMQEQGKCTGKDLQNNSNSGKSPANAEHMQKEKPAGAEGDLPSRRAD